MAKELAIILTIRYHYAHSLVDKLPNLVIIWSHLSCTHVALKSKAQQTIWIRKDSRRMIFKLEIASDNFQHQRNSVRVLLGVFHFL